MIPPSFSDLGQAARELFENCFQFGTLNVQHKCQFEGIEFETQATQLREDATLTGSFAAKYNFEDYGVTFSEQWDNDNTVTSELEVKDKLVRGLTQTFQYIFNVKSGKGSGLFKNSFEEYHVNANCDIEMKEGNQTITAATVVGTSDPRGFVMGIQMGYDVGKQEVDRLNVAGGYISGDLTLHGSYQDGIGEASVYQDISKDLESAVGVHYDSTTHATTMSMAAKYRINRKSFVKAKVDNTSVIGLAYSFQARDGVTLCVCGQLDGNNLTGGPRELGCSINFES